MRPIKIEDLIPSLRRTETETIAPYYPATRSATRFLEEAQPEEEQPEEEQPEEEQPEEEQPEEEQKRFVLTEGNEKTADELFLELARTETKIFEEFKRCGKRRSKRQKISVTKTDHICSSCQSRYAKWMLCPCNCYCCVDCLEMMSCLKCGDLVLHREPLEQKKHS